MAKCTLAHNSYALLHTPTFDVINNMHALTFDVTDSMVYRHTRHVSKSNNHQNWHRLQLLPSVGPSNDRSHYFLMYVFTPLGLAIILVYLKFSKKSILGHVSSWNMKKALYYTNKHGLNVWRWFMTQMSIKFYIPHRNRIFINSNFISQSINFAHHL